MKAICRLFLLMLAALCCSACTASEPEAGYSDADDVSEQLQTASDNWPGDIFLHYMDRPMEEKLEILRERFPDGTYWNRKGVDTDGMTGGEKAQIHTDSPCDHKTDEESYCNIYNGETTNIFEYKYNTQCLGFASLVTDFLFQPGSWIREYGSFDDIRVGDHIRIEDITHSVVVTEVGTDEAGEKYIKVLECNRNYNNCLIEWDRVITESDMEQYANVIYLTRYGDQ